MRRHDATQATEEFDFIVAGAGSAGCAVAARLSESGCYRVLLLEAGPRDRNAWIHVPMGFAKLFADPDLNWMYESEPEDGLEGRALFQPRGKVLGGTSAINGMLYIRGSPADYNEWSQRGCTGWGWDEVLRYFKKSEDQQCGANDFHGVGGPLSVSDQRYRWTLAERFVAAAIEAGLPYNPDFNGSTQDGVGYYQTTTKNGRRLSSASAYLAPARHRKNLQVRTKAQATRVLIDNGRAVGIEYRSDRGLHVARAKREVVLSGGVFNSPQLLNLSGIGPGALLQKFGLPVLVDLPAVGTNLQDHFYTLVVFRCQKQITLNDLAVNPARKALAAFQYALFRSGAFSGHGLNAGAFGRSDARLDRPDIQINMSAGSTLGREKDGLRPHPFPAFTLSAIHLRPQARGTVHLKSPDPFAAPEIRFNFLQTQSDIDSAATAVRLARKIARQFALASYVSDEIFPGRGVQTDAQLEDMIRKHGYSNLHPVGTCPMGRGPHAVVDARLRVYGVDCLRIADASIMPTIVAGNTNAPTVMIGEKAADMILTDARQF